MVTGSRADYGLLYWLMKEIQADPELELQVIATGMHLSPEFGLTYKAIESDGFVIDARVEMLLSSDTAVGIAKSIGLGVSGFGETLSRLSPDMVVVLGDRYEIFSAAQAAMILQIPLAHLAGGDHGAGTYDNNIRHCVTKMANLHFVTHDLARRRVIQLGEDPDHVFCFGATSVDNIVRMRLLSREELANELGISLGERIYLVTFHPLTMHEESGLDQMKALLGALDSICGDQGVSVIFTKPNADNGGRAIIGLLDDFVSRRSNCYLFDSLGQKRFLSAMKVASLVLGNSSSGIYEAPYLKTPTVDVGGRQRGRVAPVSVFRCEAEESAILAAIHEAMSFKFRDVEMVYGDGNASEKIVAKMKEFAGRPGLAIKSFFDFGTRQ